MKRTAILALILVLLATTLILPASATARGLAIIPTLDFIGTTAYCDLSVTADPGEEITANIKLWHGSTCLKGWTVSDEYSLEFTGTCPVVSGQTYRMTVDVKIDGVAKPQVSNTQTCP